MVKTKRYLKINGIQFVVENLLLFGQLRGAVFWPPYVFSSDNFVHRLVQNKTDGKLVEYGSGQSEVTTNQYENIAAFGNAKEGIIYANFSYRFNVVLVVDRCNLCCGFHSITRSHLQITRFIIWY